MRRGSARGIAVAVMLLGPSAARADVICVPSINIPGCPKGAAGAPTISTAVGDAKSQGDKILIAADTYNGNHPYNETVSDAGKSLTFAGAGPSKTIIQGQGSPAMTVSSGSSVSNLAVDLYNGPGNTGLQLAGTATAVAVTATQPMSTKDDIGVDLAGGKFQDGSIALPVGASDDAYYGGVIGSGTVNDSLIAAAVGVTCDGTGFDVPTVHRVRMLANRGWLQCGTNPGYIDDSVIRTVAGADTEVGLAISPQSMYGTITARHLTLVGDNASGSVGVNATASALGGPPADTSITLDSSILRSYSTSIFASATAVIGAASSTVNVSYSDYNAATSHTFSGTNATAAIKRSHSSFFDPLFVNVSKGDFHLRAGSHAIDAGDPAPLASGESGTDLDGRPRRIAGRRGDLQVSDMGAYEFQPHKPIVHASAKHHRIRHGVKDTFTAKGSDASPGDRLTFSWTFDDGTHARGARVRHAFRTAGHHRATVTARDLDGFTARASIRIVVV